MNQKEIVGLIPAAGFATRIFPLPTSKEIYPIGFSKDIIDGVSRPKVASSYLLDNMREAGVRLSYMIIREGKWDIPAYYLCGKFHDFDLAYLVTESTRGVPYTIDKAYPFVNDKRIVFGFPDILFKPSGAYRSLIEKQEATEADLVLGLFRTDNPEKMDMVETDQAGRVLKVSIKPAETFQKYAWIIAVWAPSFTRFMHEFINGEREEALAKPYNLDSNEELYIGEVIQAAVDNKLSVNSVKFKDGVCLDIGTVEGLKKATSFISG